jgi:hypothetical protein
MFSYVLKKAQQLLLGDTDAEAIAGEPLFNYFNCSGEYRLETIERKFNEGMFHLGFHLVGVGYRPAYVRDFTANYICSEQALWLVRDPNNEAHGNAVAVFAWNGPFNKFEHLGYIRWSEADYLVTTCGLDKDSALKAKVEYIPKVQDGRRFGFNMYLATTGFVMKYRPCPK